MFQERYIELTEANNQTGKTLAGETMKRYFIYAVIVGFLGNALLSNANESIVNHNIQAKLERIGV